jgi:hypothetical protein
MQEDRHLRHSGHLGEIVSGIFMVVTGVALGGTGIVLFQLAKAKAATA